MYNFIDSISFTNFIISDKSIIMAVTKRSSRKKTTKATTSKKKSSRKSASSKRAANPKAPSKKRKTKFNYCAERVVPQRQFPANVSGHRESMIIVSDKKWVNGTKLKYYFFKGGNDGSPTSWRGTNAEKEIVRQAFRAWKRIGIGLEFEETSDRYDAEIRIGFMIGDGSWSYLGRDVIDIARSPEERTMNFGWNISNDLDTAIHEIGHTLGAPHEHQNPNAGIDWNEEAVYQDLSQSPNFWDRETTYRNIIRKLPVSSVFGSDHDPNSVMHYPFGPGLINSPAQFQNGIYPPGGLSAKDKEFAKVFYPPIRRADYELLEVGISQLMNSLERE